MSTTAEISKEIEILQSLILARKYLEKLRKQIFEQKAIVQKWQVRTEKEYQDIEALEKKSIYSLFHNILGTSTDKLDFEKQEYLHAVLQLKAANESLNLLKFEDSVLKEKVKNIPHQKEKLEQLIRLREAQVLKSGNKKQLELLAIYKEMDQSVKFQREIFEAKDAGLKCKKLSTEILDLFKRASKIRSWGQSNLDHPRNKKVHLDMEKSHVDHATSKFQKLKIQLHKFYEELEDIYKSDTLNLMAHSVRFDSYVESYHNYLINDWVVKEKLASIIDLIEALHSYILRLLGAVDHIELEHLHHVKALKRKLDRLLLQ